MEIKSNHPKLTQKQISNQVRFSDSTLKRYRDDNSMDSPYNRKKFTKVWKKNTKTNTTITDTQTNTSSENTKSN